jgi:hypothetical protein
MQEEWKKKKFFLLLGHPFAEISWSVWMTRTEGRQCNTGSPHQLQPPLPPPPDPSLATAPPPPLTSAPVTPLTTSLSACVWHTLATKLKTCRHNVVCFEYVTRIYHNMSVLEAADCFVLVRESECLCMYNHTQSNAVYERLQLASAERRLFRNSIYENRREIALQNARPISRQVWCTTRCWDHAC